MKLPQFSLRDLFWLVLVCALAVGWWVERLRVHRLERDYETVVDLIANVNTPRWNLRPDLYRLTNDIRP